MSLVNVINMVVLDNPSYFTNDFSFEITFECMEDLKDDLEWKIIYVGSAEDSDHDQVLDEILVGPVFRGVHKFILSSEAPDVSKIPPHQLLGVTVVLVTCSYQQHEFVRIGYYVNNEYHVEQEDGNHTTAGDQADTMMMQETPAAPSTPADLSRVVRTILADKPRVTRFTIPWDSSSPSTTHLTPLKLMIETEGTSTSNIVSPPSTQSNHPHHDAIVMMES